MKYLSKNQIMAINVYQVKHFGGNFVPPNNFLHEENLDYLLDALNAEMFGQPLYPKIHQKAGLYMYNIIANHVFQDGNKRTGLQSAMIFLQANHYDFQNITNDDLTNFTLDVASGKYTLEQVQEWFKEHIEYVGM